MFVVHQRDFLTTSKLSPKSELLALKGDTASTSKSRGAYKGAGFSNGKYGYVASASTSKLRGKNDERDTNCSDEFPMDFTTLRVLKEIRSELAGGQHSSNVNNAELPRLLCMVYTSHLSHPSKLNAIVNTWAKECNGFFAASNFTEASVGAIDLIHSGPEEYKNMWQKVRSMWAYVHEHYLNDYDYFHICGDDTYVVVDNLRLHLLSLNHSTSGPIFLGTPMRHKGSYFAAGGSGYTLNQAAVKLLAEHALDMFLTENVDSREDVFVSSLLEKVGVKLTHANDENGLLKYMHLNPPTFVTKYTYEGKAHISGTNKASGKTVSIHMNYNRQGKGRTLYADSDIAEIMHRYHDVLEGKCDHDVPMRPGLPDLSKGGLILFFHLPKTGGSSLRYLAKTNDHLEYYSNEHRSMNASKDLITQWTQTSGHEKVGRTKFFEFHWNLEPCKYFVLASAD